MGDGSIDSVPPDSWRYLSTDRKLSQPERELLRIKLDKILQSLKEGDSNRPLVAAHLQAGTSATR